MNQIMPGKQTREEPKPYRLKVRRHGKWSFAKEQGLGVGYFPKPVAFADAESAMRHAADKFPGVPEADLAVVRVEARRLV